MQTTWRLVWAQTISTPNAPYAPSESPGGFLFARLAAEIDEDRPQHIVQYFEPTFARLRTLGFAQVWQDDWLWGHQVFRNRKRYRARIVR